MIKFKIFRLKMYNKKLNPAKKIFMLG